MTNGDMIREAVKNNPDILEAILEDYYLERCGIIVCRILTEMAHGDIDEETCSGCPLYDYLGPNWGCLAKDELHEWLLDEAKK